MTPCTDVCTVCKHIENAQDERSFNAKNEHKLFQANGRITEVSFGQCLPLCSMSMTKCYYTFDLQSFPPSWTLKIPIVYSCLECVMKHTHSRYTTCTESKIQWVKLVMGELCRCIIFLPRMVAVKKNATSMQTNVEVKINMMATLSIVCRRPGKDNHVPR